MSIIGMRNKMSKYLKGLVIALAVAFAVGFIAMTIGPGRAVTGQGGRQETGVLAKVNGEKLLWKDYLDLLQRQMQQYEMAGPIGPSMETQLRWKIFDQMVGEMMRVQAAKKEGVRVSGKDLRKKIDEYTDMQMKSLREQALSGKKKKTDAVFAAQLAKIEPGMTIEKKRKQIRKEMEAVSDQIRKSIMLEKLDKKIEDSVVVNDKALEESFDEAKLAQMTIASTGKRSDEQAKKRAEEIVAKLRKGDDFAAIAKLSSDDMYKAFGGVRGSVRRGHIEPELREAAFKLKAGEISDPIKTEQGYVILKSDGVVRNLPSDLGKKKKEYMDQFATEQREMAKSDFYTKIRKELKLEIFDPELKAYAAFRDAYQNMMAMSETARKKEIEKVIKLYQEALVGADDDTGLQARCNVQVAMLYGMLKSSPLFGVTAEEKGKYEKLAREALDTALVYTEDVGLRISAARAAIDAKDPESAKEHLQLASENAYNEVQAHEQIRDMYKEMKLSDLAAAEQKWIDDYNKEQGQSGTGTVTTEPIRIPAGGE